MDELTLSQALERNNSIFFEINSQDLLDPDYLG
jgi:hypothetical protein